MERPLALVGARRMVNAHLSNDELAAMVDGKLPPARRAHVSAHLAVCHECRSELTLVTNIVETGPRRPAVARRWAPLSLGLAAAAILFFVSLPVVRNGPAPTADVRSAVSSATAISVIAPSANSSLEARAGSIRFSWHAVPGVSTYRLFVIDSAGVPVRTLATSDTTVADVGPALLQPGGYFWYVDALRVDGSPIASPQTGFSIRPR